MGSHELPVSIIYEDSLPGTTVRRESNARAFTSAVATLTLAILGSSTLPVPFAFSRLGLVLGIGTMFLVAGCNAITCHVLLRASGSLHHDSYEGVAEAAGGATLKLVTQISLGLLLFGTLVGDYALLADVGPRAIQRLLEPKLAPEWLVGYDGRGVMVLLVIAVIFPLCMLRRMRSLELVGMSGCFVVLGLMAIFVRDAVAAGFPGICSGEFPIWGVQLTPDLPEAFAVMGFAFYCQPMLMPLLHEMPRGERGLRLTSAASATTILVVATVVYGTLGVFGAARYGLATEGNVLVNQWLGGRAEGILDLVMVAYLAISAPIVQMSLRYTVDTMLVGEGAPYHWPRHLTETSVILSSSLALALFFPTYAEKIFAITGVIPVCLVCYILPVIIHLHMFCCPGGRGELLGLTALCRVFQRKDRRRLRCGRQQSRHNDEDGEHDGGHVEHDGDNREWRCTSCLVDPRASRPVANGAMLFEPLLPNGQDGKVLEEAAGEAAPGQLPSAREAGSPWWEITREVAVPIGVAFVGLGFSIGAMWVAVQNLI